MISKKYIFIVGIAVFAFFCKKAPTFEPVNELDPISDGFQLPIPNQLTVNIVNYDAVKLEWDISNYKDFLVDDDLKFEIQRSTIDDTFKTIKTVDFASTVIDSFPFVPDLNYLYRLRAVKKEKKSEFINSSPLSYSLNAPANITIFGIDKNNAQIKWENTNSLKTDYLIEFKKQSEDNYQSIFQTRNKTETELTNLDSDSDYEIKISSIIPSFQSPSSEVVLIRYSNSLRKNTEFIYQPSYISARRITYSQNGERVIVGTDQGEIHLFLSNDLSLGPISKFETGTNFIYFVGSINNSTEIIAIDESDTFYIFDENLILKEKRYFKSTHFSGSLKEETNNNIIVFSTYGQEKLYFYSIEQSEIVDSLSFINQSGEPRAKFSKDGSRLITVHGKNLDLRSYPELEILSSYVLPDLSRIYGFSFIEETNYIMISGGGFFWLLQYNQENKMNSVYSSEVNFAFNNGIYSFRKDGLAFLGNDGSHQSINIFDTKFKSRGFVYNKHDNDSRYSNYFDEHPIMENTFIESGADNYLTEWTFRPNWNRMDNN
ncbi:MAG: fibronectin type III domain-containing protein [Balneola sp.]